MNTTLETRPLENITDRQRQAQKLHTQIMLSGETAANALLEMARGLKEMRDGKLYLEMGYETFEEYTTGAVGLKQRQAYTYITTYEKLGERFLQSNASLGIAKLEQLAAINPIERVEFMEETNVEDMTARELKAKVAELNAVKEQLSFLQGKAEDAEEREQDKAHTIEELEGKLRELQRQMAEQEQKPDALTEEEAEKIRTAARKEAEQQAKQREAEAIKAAKEKQEKKAAKELEESLRREREKLRREYQESLSALSEDKEQYKAQLERLKKEQQVSGDNPEVLKFTFYYEQMKAAVKNMLETAEKLRGTELQTAQKLEGGLQKYLTIVLGRLEDGTKAE